MHANESESILWVKREIIEIGQKMTINCILEPQEEFLKKMILFLNAFKDVL
jgi:hypothetical protein